MGHSLAEYCMCKYVLQVKTYNTERRVTLHNFQYN